jgi:ribonuclease-3
MDEFSNLRAFQEKLGYFFRDGGLLETALRHASYAYENGLAESNERLEFLGDSVLGMGVALILYESYPEATEGELTRDRMEFVCRDALVRWAESLNLESVLWKGKSLRPTPPSVFADGVEAVLGAVYLDGGHDAALRTIRRYLFESGTSLPNGGERDAKSKLQTRLQAEDMGLPRYEVLSVTGPSHAPSFLVRVFAAGKTWNGRGASRKAAELAAAAVALEALEELEEMEGAASEKKLEL